MVLAAALTECFFGNGSWGIQCRYHAAPVATSSSAAVKRAIRTNAGRTLPRDADFGLRERSTADVPRLMRISGLGRGLSSTGVVSWRSTGGAGTTRGAAEERLAGASAGVAEGFA